MRKLLTGLTIVVGMVLILMGLGLAGGGAYLLSLGGSWFYLPAGLAMAAIGGLLVARRALALWIALALLVVAAIWAFSEVGSDFWQLVPRLIAFLVIAMLVSAAAPLLRDKAGAAALGCKPAGVLAAVLAIGLVGFFAGMFRPHPTVVAQGDASPVVTPDAGQADGNDWSAYGRTTSGERFAQFDQINKNNVKDLTVAWTYRTGDLAVDGAEYQVTPLKVDDTVYLCTPLSKVMAVDATTGKEKWRFDPKAVVSQSTQGWKRCRGVGYADLDKLAATPAHRRAPARPGCRDRQAVRGLRHQRLCRPVHRHRPGPGRQRPGHLQRHLRPAGGRWRGHGRRPPQRQPQRQRAGRRGPRLRRGDRQDPVGLGRQARRHRRHPGRRRAVPAGNPELLGHRGL
jgi:quinate dehydrogenase (quinone)